MKDRNKYNIKYTLFYVYGKNVTVFLDTSYYDFLYVFYFLFLMFMYVMFLIPSRQNDATTERK